MPKDSNGNGKVYARVAAALLLATLSWVVWKVAMDDAQIHSNTTEIAVQHSMITVVREDVKEIKQDVKELLRRR